MQLQCISSNIDSLTLVCLVNNIKRTGSYQILINSINLLLHCTLNLKKKEEWKGWRRKRREEEREGERGGREGGREGEREGGREGGRKGGREGGREGEREGGREREEGGWMLTHLFITPIISEQTLDA